MKFYRCFTLFTLISVTALVRGECDSGKYQGTYSHYRRSIYEDLRCTPEYEEGIIDCPVKYNCSHIYDRPEKTCHFQGKFYKVGERINNEELSGTTPKDCRCAETLEFQCPYYADGCAAYWVEDYYPKPDCYYRYELNQECPDVNCPPFDDNAQCEVDGTTYREGEKFNHPTRQCVECVCEKGFDGKFEAPFCQPLNCTAEVKHSKDIDNFCAPYYDYVEGSCCPDSWICPMEGGVYHFSSLGTSDTKPDFQCQFGNKTLSYGDYWEYQHKDLGNVTCTCGVPPYLYCTVYPINNK